MQAMVLYDMTCSATELTAVADMQLDSSCLEELSSTLQANADSI